MFDWEGEDAEVKEVIVLDQLPIVSMDSQSSTRSQNKNCFLLVCTSFMVALVGATRPFPCEEVRDTIGLRGQFSTSSLEDGGFLPVHLEWEAHGGD
jgi:hypothetical protein